MSKEDVILRSYQFYLFNYIMCFWSFGITSCKEGCYVNIRSTLPIITICATSFFLNWHFSEDLFERKIKDLSIDGAISCFSLLTFLQTEMCVPHWCLVTSDSEKEKNLFGSFVLVKNNNLNFKC